MFRKEELSTIRCYINKGYKQRLGGEVNKHWNKVKFVRDYLEGSSVHGTRHLVAPYRHVSEYVFWFIITTFSIFQTINQSLMTMNRYENYPTVTVLENTFRTWKTDLSSAYLCPENKIDSRMLQEFIKSTYKESEWELVKENLEFLSRFSFKSVEAVPLQAANISSQKFMEIINAIKNDISFQTKINYERESIYKFAILEIGICAAVNSWISAYNSPQLFYNETFLEPNGTFEPVNGNYLDGDLIKPISAISTEFHAYFIDPSDVPDSTTQTWKVNERTQTTFELNALAITSSEDIKTLSIKQRGCRYKDESNLTISNVYSYNLCRMDCRRRLAFELCSCTPHFYKNIDGDQVCDLDGLRCLTSYRNQLLWLIDPRTNQKLSCGCYPNCFATHYNVENSNSINWMFGTNMIFGIYKFPKLRVRRELIFGIPDLVVSIGGIAALFLGVSVLSIVEIIYFFTLRLLCQRWIKLHL